MPSGPTPSTPPFRARFVTATQQLLALGVVCAGLTPAVGVMSLDVVAEAPSGAGAAVLAADTPNARVAAGPGGGSRLTSVPQRVTGYGSVGVTWAHGVEVSDEDLTF